MHKVQLFIMVKVSKQAIKLYKGLNCPITLAQSTTKANATISISMMNRSI